MAECRVVRSGGEYSGKAGLDYQTGISAQTVGSSRLCMHLVELPDGARANAHLHQDHETAIYVLEGTVDMLYGPSLEQHLRVSAGDFLYIPPGVPHLPYNTSGKPARAVLARTDPDEQESVVLTPELESLLTGPLAP